MSHLHKSLKLEDYFTYLGSNVSSTESNDNICRGKAWTAIDRLSIMWKSDLYDKIKRKLFLPEIAEIFLSNTYPKWVILNNIKFKIAKFNESNSMFEPH